MILPIVYLIRIRQFSLFSLKVQKDSIFREFTFFLRMVKHADKSCIHRIYLFWGHNRFFKLEREKAKLPNPYQINYSKDHSGNEVDFVIRNGRDIKTLINVTDANLIDEINAREIKALLMASRELRCNNLQISWSNCTTGNFGGFKLIFRKHAFYRK